jgi:hypothetical protein
MQIYEEPEKFDWQAALFYVLLIVWCVAVWAAAIYGVVTFLRGV